MRLALPVQRKPQYIGILVLLAIALLSLFLRLNTPRLGEVQFSDYQSYRCAVPGEPAGADLQLLTLADVNARPLADRVCAGDAVGRRYGGAQIRWRPRSFIDAQDVLEGHYDLFWNRRHLMLGKVPQFFDYYRPLLETPNYALYWLSREPLQALTPDYLAGKVVGLLADTSSQTFYLRPMNALNQAGVHLLEGQLRLFPDPQSLFHAFSAGEVDLISGLVSMAEQFELPYQGTLLIEDNVPSGAWFVKKSLIGTGVECDLLAALQGMTADMVGGGEQVAQGIDCP